MPFDTLFRAKLDSLREAGNYRVFADLERHRGQFRQRHHIVEKCKQSAQFTNPIRARLSIRNLSVLLPLSQVQRSKVGAHDAEELG